MYIRSLSIFLFSEENPKAMHVEISIQIYVIYVHILVLIHYNLTKSSYIIRLL